MFSRFLNEGLIKLPQETLDAANKFFLEKYLAYLSFNAQKYIEDDLDMEMAVSGIKRLAKSYGVILPTAAEAKKAGSVKYAVKPIKLGGLPDAYIKRLTKLHGDEVAKTMIDGKTLRFILDMEGHPEVGDEQGAFKPATMEMFISLKNNNLHSSQIIKHLLGGNFAEINRRIKSTETIIEHELTHAVQHGILKFLHSKQVERTTGADLKTADGTEVYLLSPIEFDPWIKTSIDGFSNIVKHHKNTTGHTMRKLLDRFTWADVAPNAVDEVVKRDSVDRSAFFMTLRKHDQNKWKKAVKLLTSAYDKKHGDKK